MENFTFLTCPDKIVCHCLQISERQLLQALAENDVDSFKELRSCTGAGNGCNCCHPTLKEYLNRQHCFQLVECSTSKLAG